MSKALIGGIVGVSVLLLCCCLCCGALYFTGSMSDWVEDWDVETDYDDDFDDWDELSDELEDIEKDLKDSLDDSGTKKYTGDDFSFNYPDTWTVNDSGSQITVKPTTGSDKVNILVSLNKNNDMKYPNQAQCETLMKAALDYVAEAFTIINTPKTTYTETYYPGCKTTNVELKPDDESLLEQEYHILVNTENRDEVLSVILTTSINKNIDYYPEMKTILNSLQF